MGGPGVGDDVSESSDEQFQAVQAALAARWPENRVAPSLDRIAALMDLLGSPNTVVPTIQVAGTNGKTSTARLIEALLRDIGLRTGLFTSPHLTSVTERIVVDGDPISEEEFVATYRDIEPFLDVVDASAAAEATPMTYFEVLTGMAFARFADAPVGVSVLEAGMGGAWDATNVARNDVAVITPVSLDHTDYLGADLRSIAGEKAGIIPAGGICLIAEQPSDVADLIEQQALRLGTRLLQQGVDFRVESRDVALGGQLLTIRGLAGVYEDVFVPLHGSHQADNAALAVATVEAFLGGGRESLDADVVESGLRSVRVPGRLEFVRRDPTVLLDSAHNPAGASSLAHALAEEFSFARLVGVVGVLADKDAEGILGALEPVLDAIVVTAPLAPRALPTEDLALVARRVFGPDRVHEIDSLDDALVQAIHDAEGDRAEGLASGVIVTGSVTTVGQARTLLGGR